MEKSGMDAKGFFAENIMFHMVQMILYLMSGMLLISAALFFVNRCLDWKLIFFSILIAMILLVIFYGREADAYIVLEVVLSVIIILSSAWIMGNYYDFTWDGNDYHKVAVGLLDNGWNPLKEVPTMEISEGGRWRSAAAHSVEIWCEVYCKATWIFAAGIYAVAGNIECGKAYTILGMICCLFITIYFMRRKGMSWNGSVVIALVAAFNPISVQQMFSFYVDGFLHSMLYILIISLLMLDDRDRFDVKISASLVAASMIICGNIKFTGLLYCGVFCVLYFFRECLKQYKENRDKRQWLKVMLKYSLFYMVSAVVTVFWAGNSSYLTNFIRYGNIVYPLIGTDKIDIITPNSPFTDENHFKNLFISLFSRLDNFSVEYGGTIHLKVPFSVNWEYENIMLDAVDLRLSGFGILFGGIIICAMIIIVAYIVTTEKNKIFWLIVMNFMGCLGLTFVIKESWWARYAPYIYYIVIISEIILLISDKKILKRLGIAFAFIIMINNCMPLKHTYSMYIGSKYVAQQLEGLVLEGAVLVNCNTFKGIYYNMKDMGIYYFIDENIDEENANALGYMETYWCNVE